MATNEENVYSLLLADPALLTILEGGVYQDRTMRMKGINREETPDAYDANGLLQTCAIVKGRGKQPTSLRDQNTQLTSYSEVVEVWLYSDADGGYNEIEDAKGRIYALLNETRIEGAHCIFIGELPNGNAPELGDATMSKVEYEINGIYSVS